MVIGKIKVKISLRKWAKPVAFVFVLFGIPLPKWLFKVSRPYVHIDDEGK